MLTRRTIMLGTACAAVAAPALAADASAMVFVTAIYDAYKARTDMGPDRQRSRRPALFRAVACGIDHEGPDGRGTARRATQARWRSIRRRSGLEIAAFDIAVSDTAPGKASATVKFDNSGEQTTVVLDLVKIKNDWRISDITWLRDGKPSTLRHFSLTEGTRDEGWSG